VMSKEERDDRFIALDNMDYTAYCRPCRSRKDILSVNGYSLQKVQDHNPLQVYGTAE
jgi:hypothetical protein